MQDYLFRILYCNKIFVESLREIKKIFYKVISLNVKQIKIKSLSCDLYIYGSPYFNA